MSAENVELIRRGYEVFVTTGEPLGENLADDSVWDMSTFRGWSEQQTYDGLEGMHRFIDDWVGAWEDWRLEVEELHDAGDYVVAVLHQSGRSKSTGLPVDMHFAQVWTVRDGKQTHMRMFREPEEAFRAVGLRLN